METNTRIIRLPVDEAKQLEQLSALHANGWCLCGVLPASNGDVLAYLQRPDGAIYTDRS